MDKLILSLALSLVLALLAPSSMAATVFQNERFTGDDAILVVDLSGLVVFDWRSEAMMIPASLTKLATSHIAITKWGLDHRFVTDFYRVGNTLWIKGYGDPFLISEELDVVAASLLKQSVDSINAISIDDRYFDVASVPGRSASNDPYNAPLSAVAANFNTVKLRLQRGKIESAESQTPLTATAKLLGAQSAQNIGERAQRINLVNQQNAQRHFAELLVAKLGLSEITVNVDQVLPSNARLVYRHHNTHTLADLLRGTLEFSNNFIANQLFVNFAQPAKGTDGGLTFKHASAATEAALASQFAWRDHKLVEGSGLSRKNRLSARQLNDLLSVLQPNKTLFKSYQGLAATVHAKTGTLDGVRSFAGYVDLPSHASYQFVFLFNRKVPWQHREKILKKLIRDLKLRDSGAL